MPARRAALAILDRAARGTPFDVARDQSVESLAGRDRRLAHELAAGVLRHEAELDRALAPLVSRGLDSVPPKLRRVLRLGAYQLLRLDRVPAHAAVATSVDLARERSGEQAARFVNAVLRKVEIRPAASGTVSIAQRYSHPAWLVNRWLERFGPEETEQLLARNNTRPALTVQPARWTTGELMRAFAAAGVTTDPAPFEAGITLRSTRPQALPGYREGGFLVQDPAQALVARFVTPPAGGTVYDACAAPGGKSLALGRVGCLVVAGEARRDRLGRLRENLARAGSGREFPVAADAARPPVRPCDVVLLDVPCLGTGTFARHPEARGRVSSDALAWLVERQEVLLEAVASVVSPGGLLVYSTCSLEPEENEHQVSRFLDRHPEFHREPPRGWAGAQLSPMGDLALFPQRHGTDGAFAARLRKAG